MAEQVGARIVGGRWEEEEVTYLSTPGTASRALTDRDSNFLSPAFLSPGSVQFLPLSARGFLPLQNGNWELCYYLCC